MKSIRVFYQAVYRELEDAGLIVERVKREFKGFDNLVIDAFNDELTPSHVAMIVLDELEGN